MRSDIVKKGSTRAAHRALFHAMGYTDEDLQKPLIGVVNAFSGKTRNCRSRRHAY